MRENHWWILSRGAVLILAGGMGIAGCGKSDSGPGPTAAPTGSDNSTDIPAPPPPPEVATDVGPKDPEANSMLGDVKGNLQLLEQTTNRPSKPQLETATQTVRDLLAKLDARKDQLPPDYQGRLAKYHARFDEYLASSADGATTEPTTAPMAN